MPFFSSKRTNLLNSIGKSLSHKSLIRFSFRQTRCSSRAFADFSITSFGSSLLLSLPSSPSNWSGGRNLLTNQSSFVTLTTSRGSQSIEDSRDKTRDRMAITGDTDEHSIDYNHGRWTVMRRARPTNSLPHSERLYNSQSEVIAVAQRHCV